MIKKLKNTYPQKLFETFLLNNVQLYKVCRRDQITNKESEQILMKQYTLCN